MDFNSFVWGLYRDSEEGRSAIARDISDYLSSSEVLDEDYFFAECYYYEVSKGEPVENGRDGFEIINLRELIQDYASKRSVSKIEDAEKLFTEIADEGIAWSIENEGKSFQLIFGGGNDDVYLYSDIFTYIAGLSAGLHDAHPEFFAPYLFARRFDEFERICRSFDIPLPEIPGKLKKRERALYYVSINRALYGFRKYHGLSPQELMAFLYDFTKKSLNKRPETQNVLPPPSRVWFVIGGARGAADFKFLDSIDESSVSHWQGSLETRRGDIVLIWCASPRS